MHGLIHAELAKCIKKHYGMNNWEQILKQAGFNDRVYLQVGSYPDEEIVTIIVAAAKVLGVGMSDLLEEFGGFILPDLFDMYRSYIDPSWKTLDFLLNTEETIHRVVRLKNKGAAPPKLNFEKVSESAIRLHYDSERNMLPVAKGMIRAVAEHFDEQVIMRVAAADDGGWIVDIEKLDEKNKI